MLTLTNTSAPASSDSGAAAAAAPESRVSERQLERAASNFAPTAFQSTTFHQAAR